ncbi:mediator of RNA polymerase II transcription subunit 13-like [Uloborus diversus]|uniref:mediator of RNA polymerase II transcription subunit 13-like n=1 Tax=Uloborus diversus TaxID=327109 RepID=UPI00240A45B8|nr:mediator of RNA polymerase II transcription subunit 13-like [Uloborus diversus]
MTHVGDVTNGASLEDCHTNFFALADLNGIKWRKLHSDTVTVDPLDDPILTSYSKCLSASVLAVWRSIVTPKNGTPGAVRELNTLSSSKELWIFWYGEGPDFSEFISPSLSEMEQGSWESGLSYECRTLLFKALHNVIERHLLSHGFTRLGEYFVEPQVFDATSRNWQHVFRLHFFIHGESTVCTCIDARLTTPVYALQKSHIHAAQSHTKNVKVILSPYGIEGKLTGPCFKYSDPNMARFLNLWHSFYPHIHRKDKLKMFSGDPNVVEVLVGGLYMKYPASYVFVVEEDIAKTFPSSKASNLNSSTLKSTASHISPSGLLTPPMSPIENSTLRDNSRTSADLLGDSQNILENNFHIKIPKFHDCIKYSVSQECCISVISEKSDDSPTLWDFQDPSAVIKCSCCSKISKGKSVQSSSSGNGFSTANQSSESSVNHRSLKNEKFNSHYMGIPFHRQKPNQKEERFLQNICISFLSKDSEKPELRSSETNSCTSNLPQLQTPLSHIKSESLSNVSSTDTFYASVSSLDPVMPTLSPQPPMIKEESNVQSYEFSQANNSSPGIDSPKCVNLKGKISEEILSPLHASLLNMFENAKNVSKLSPIAANPEPDPVEQVESSSCPRSNKSQIIEKPQLPKRSHEDDNPQMTMTGLLYDYQTFNAPLWEPPPFKRKCFLATQKSVQVYNDETDDSDEDNALDNFDSFDEAVPSAPKDPYEFTEFDETAPSERGFRQKAESYLKEEERIVPPSLPSPIVPLSPIPNDPAIAQEALISHDSDKVPSPAAIKVPSKFIREEDLAVSLHDLDNIFDTSSSEGEDNTDPPVTPSKLHPLDEFSGKIELSRMYPTPPSLEQNAVPSPFGLISGNESNADQDAIRENHEDMFMKNLNLDEDISVWKPAALQKFVESPKYLYITELSSVGKSSDTDLDLVYKSSWFQPSSKMNYTNVCEENAQSETYSEVLSRKNVFKWYARFRDGRDSLEDDPRPGHSGIIHKKFIPEGESVNAAYYLSVLKRLWARIHRVRPEYQNQGTWSFLHDNAPAHKILMVRNFLAQKSIVVLDHPPYSPDLAPADFWLFPKLKLAMKGKHFVTVSDIQAATTAKLGAIPKDGQQQVYGTFDEERVCHTIYQSESALDSQFTLSNCDSVSSVSSLPSYLNKSNNSTDSNYSRPVLEAHALLVNLILSDSMLNTFKDHNFDSCCLCVCNMNIKGSDAGNILPSFLIPNGNDEPQYKCTCGFSAVTHRHRSFNAGLFFEDEYEITGIDCDTIKNFSQSFFDIPSEGQSSEAQKVILPHSNHVPDFILDLLRIQCKSINSRFSLFFKSRMQKKHDSFTFSNSIEIYDRCEILFLALEDSKNSIDSPASNRLDEALKSTSLHKWPYVSSPLPSTSEDIMLFLDSLKPILQAAVHKKNTQRMWDITYVVSGPLTWREFHTLAARGSEDQCDPQPIPSLLMSQDHECIAVSPFALKFWDKLHLEPYSLGRDVAYIVVAPESDFVLSRVKNFFKELSIMYESHGFGRHTPITKVLRDGIMRVGKTAASKVAEEPVGEWFNNIGDGSISNKLKLYARVCRHRLAPHLSTLTLDENLFSSSSKVGDKNAGLANLVPSSIENTADKPATPKNVETELSTDNIASLQSLSDQKDGDHLSEPALVIYIVEPFTFAQCDSEVYRLVTLGLMHSYHDMVACLPEAMKNGIQLQILSLDSILCFDDIKKPRKDEIRSLAFSVFAQSHQLHSSQSNAKSLTGFGPAAAQEGFLKTEKSKIQRPLKIYNQPFILASVKDKQTELNEMFGDRKQSASVLYCSYCLTKDKRFILASCTNDKGEFTETNIINISIPSKNQRKYASVRKFGLHKLLDFILEVISVSVQPWRLVIERFGRLGHGELKTWACLLSRKAMQSYSKRLQKLCHQCAISEAPSILSACLVSVEPDAALRLMPDQFTPDGSYSSSRSKTCHLSTPEDATCTHILVFPTSATTQPSQAHKEQMDPLPGLGEDLFEELNDDISGINEILQWSESPGSPENSHRDGFSQPSSPTSSYRFSSTHHGESHTQLSMCGENVADTLDESQQLLQQPLALGYYVSTAETGTLPKWFWSSCPQMENKLPVFLKSSLLIHIPFAQYSEDVLHNSPPQQLHPLDSNFTTDILRYVLEGHNALSWLALDSKYNDRRSCLPIHMQMLMQLYDIVEAIL